MSSIRKIIRAFLASPGDLQEERKAIRGVVDEFNESWADELGYQVELIGWEETISGFGRPQQLINQDLDRCDLFLGMIWKRWGTPPDHGGGFSSGFEEEFERSVARREKDGSPEISLFFKQIPDEFMVDPGNDLKKVLEFREKIIADKKILFQSFTTLRDIETLIRKCVTAYVNRVRAEEEFSEPNELRAKLSQSASGEAREEDSGRESSPLSAEGLIFLESLVKRFGQSNSLDSLNASDIARFRLLANSISKSGNEEMNLGVHDINILYKARTEGLVFGEKETRCLACLGFQHLSNENVPLWCWYSDLLDSKQNLAVISSFIGANDNEKIGAISVLTGLALDLPTDDDMINRDLVISVWFSDETSVRVRTAALKYLAKCGTAGDLEIAKKEYDRNDYGTSRSALECIVAILLRTGQARAAKELVLESQFESLNANLLSSVIENFDDVETPVLRLGLEHRNPKVRLSAMVALYSRGLLDIGMAERLSGDSDALVRREAVSALLKHGKPLAEEDVKKILVQPQKQPMNALSAAGSDRAGNELFHQYQLDVLKRFTEAELEKKVAASFLYDEAAYFALMEKYFKNRADELRRDVDDRFGAYYEERIRRAKAFFGDSTSSQKYVKQARDIEEYWRKELTRKGLNVLCVAHKPEDLQRIRANLRDGYAGASKFDAEYLGRHGEWADIPILTNAEGPKNGARLLTISADEEFQAEVASAITSISKKHSISDLLSLEIPAAILKKTIELCAESRFARISRNALLNLLNNESESVRKAAAVLAVRALPAKRIRTILSEYIGSKHYRYYNVIHWLDLGASMRRDDARKVARAAFI